MSTFAAPTSQAVAAAERLRLKASSRRKAAMAAAVFIRFIGSKTRVSIHHRAVKPAERDAFAFKETLANSLAITTFRAFGSKKANHNTPMCQKNIRSLLFLIAGVTLFVNLLAAAEP